MRTAAVAVIALAVLIVLLPATAQQPAPPASGAPGQPGAAAPQARPHLAPSHDHPAEAVFENIKVLNGIPSDEVVPSMRFFAGALGVGCDHCHFPDKGHEGFANDDKKPKQIARQMITMVKQINDNNFKGEQEVTCATCHNGKPNPSRTAPVATPELLKARANMQPLPDRSTFPQATQLFQSFTDAIGGQAAVDKLKSIRATGQIDLGRGGPVTFEAMQEAPNKSYTKVDFAPNRVHTEAFDGTTAWAKDGPRVNELQGAELAATRLDANFYLEFDPKKVFPNAQTRGKDKIGDTDVWVVRASQGRDQPQELFYFDAANHQLLRRVLLVPTPFGPLNTQLDYADWHEVNGVKIAFTITQTRPGGITTQKLTKVELNVPVDEKMFAKPASDGAAAPGTR
jgi:hypothetical protein